MSRGLRVRVNSKHSAWGLVAESRSKGLAGLAEQGLPSRTSAGRGRRSCGGEGSVWRGLCLVGNTSRGGNSGDRALRLG